MAKQGADVLLVRKLVAEAREGGHLSAAAAWARDGAGNVNDLGADEALAAIEAALQLGNAAAIATASTGARDKAVRKAAGAAVHKLKSKGQSVEVQRDVRSWSMGDEPVPELPPFAMLGRPDTEGYFPFLLVATGAETIVFAGMAGGGQGFKDVDHTHLGRAQRRQVLADARRDETLFELPFHTALHLVERGFDLAGQRPHEWAHLLEQLDEGLLNTARLVDPFAHEQTLIEDVLAQALPLLEGPSAVMLMPAVEVVQKLVADLRDAPDGAVDAAADAALTPLVRRTWAMAMDVVATLAGARGWDDVRGPARQTALALRADRPGRQVPYVVGVIERIAETFAGLESTSDPDVLDETVADQ